MVGTLHIAMPDNKGAVHSGAGQPARLPRASRRHVALTRHQVEATDRGHASPVGRAELLLLQELHKQLRPGVVVGEVRQPLRVVPAPRAHEQVSKGGWVLVVAEGKADIVSVRSRMRMGSRPQVLAATIAVWRAITHMFVATPA